MKKTKGRIHSFETFGAVDGPGIRFIVFMQGCLLKCKYCQNRDTWDAKGGEEYTTDQVVDKILRCKPYIDVSNGGVTISGGEPLLQTDFLVELFRELKNKEIHTAIDTSGCIKINDKIVELLKYTDLVLLDIKHIDEKKCIELTGKSNKNELLFARYCSDNNIDLWIRQVLVPGYTDNEKDLKDLPPRVMEIKTVKKVEILPYHNLGKFKWEKLGEVYPLENVKTPTKKEIDKAKSILVLNNNIS